MSWHLLIRRHCTYLVLQPLSGAATKSNLTWHLQYDLADAGTYLCTEDTQPKGCYFTFFPVIFCVCMPWGGHIMVKQANLIPCINSIINTDMLSLFNTIISMSQTLELRRKLHRNSTSLTICAFTFVLFLPSLQQQYLEFGIFRFLISKGYFLESENMPVC